MHEYPEKLFKTALFQNMGRSEIKRALSFLKPKFICHKKNSYVLMAGDSIKNLCLLMEGSLQMVYEDVGGEQAIMMQYQPGDCIFEIFLHVYPAKSPSSVFAAKDSFVMHAPFENIRLIPEKIRNKIFKNLYAVTCRKTHYIHRHLMHASRPGIRKKLISYFKELETANGKNEFVIPMSKSDLADYLFVSKESLSRELAAMKKDKLIDFKGRRVFLKTQNSQPFPIW